MLPDKYHVKKCREVFLQKQANKSKSKSYPIKPFNGTGSIKNKHHYEDKIGRIT